MKTVAYKRSRFGTRLPADYRYTPAHYWLRPSGEDGVWEVGFTVFATRMLGDIVEFDFPTAPGAQVETGQVLGWTEGFKAMSDVYSVASGAFLGANPALSGAITLLDDDPYDRGWLYRLRAGTVPETLDVNGYIAVLDATIDKMLAGRHGEQGDPSDG
ncbi:MAG: glycine cleavage system protein H [Bryobacterales bacterium]|nr:glycine cleavage system protein H [Bryobacterales bacterium]